MKQNKRRRSNSFDENNTKRFLAIANYQYVKKFYIKTQIEDLPNELIHEIFDYLDSYHAYQSFYNLNYRFQSFFPESTVPLKINLPLMSKTEFHRYNEDIIKPNQQRIHLLRISNSFMFNNQTFALSYKTSLQTLIIENIRSTYLIDILHQLTSLSHLSSLTISTFNAIENVNSIYEHIFHLSTLRYCKLSLKREYPIDVIPIKINAHSSIEHLIIEHGLDLNELIALLSCAPHLHHLSILLWHKNDFILTSSCHISNFLTNLSIRMCSEVTFDDLKMFFINYAPFVQALRVKVHEEYIDANSWKELISSSLPNLRIFDMKCQMGSPVIYFNRKNIEKQMKRFNSSFWTERKWFFDYRIHLSEDFNHSVFHSTNPYRRKEYKLCNESIQTTNSLKNHSQTIFKSVHRVTIVNEQALDQSMCYFPQAVQLSFGWRCPIRSFSSIITKIDRILPLQQIKVLEIGYECVHLPNICELLYLMPNVHTLKLRSILFEKSVKLSIEQYKHVVQSISKTSSIQNLTLNGRCTLEKLELLVKLFPRVQYLQMSIQLHDMEPVLQFLLNKKNTITRHLILLSFLSVEKYYLRYLKQLIKSRVFSHDLKTTYANYNDVLYVWW